MWFSGMILSISNKLVIFNINLMEEGCICVMGTNFECIECTPALIAQPFAPSSLHPHPTSAEP